MHEGRRGTMATKKASKNTVRKSTSGKLKDLAPKAGQTKGVKGGRRLVPEPPRRGSML
jgi:hypothetical protein